MVSISAHTGAQAYNTTLTTVSGNSIAADETAANGGSGKGFTPHELLASALASCTTITLRMYANRKQWPVDAIDVTVSIIGTDTGNIFQRDITITGAITTEQKQRLLHIANQCPVHKTLSNPIQINTGIK